MSYTSNVSKYINSVFKEFPDEIAVFKNKKNTYAFASLIGEMTKILKTPSDQIKGIPLIIELMESTVNIHSQISSLPRTDINTKLIILSGDLLFAHALEKIPTITNPHIRNLIFKKISTVTKADIFLGLMAASRKSFQLDKYQKMAERRYGSFSSLGFSIPAYYSKINKKNFYLLEKIGISIGVIRQILIELHFFENDTLTLENIQLWYFPFLTLSKTKWKKKLTSSPIEIASEKMGCYKAISSNVEKLWKKNKTLIKKLPVDLRAPIAKICDLYLKDLSLEKWIKNG